ncbi:Alpha-(1,3)-fucosyltransferase C [Aphelenchoides besseyi]|nr:Alpha-(1,3)-fucosyltransferase C [Aphelenchoides besseyi]
MCRPTLPIILYWQPYFVNEYDMFVPDDGQIDCPYRCIHTANHRLGAEAAVRVFHERRFNTADLPPDNQYALNVMHTLEPPFFTFSIYDEYMKSIPDYFNATSSYRTMSAIYYPYDYFVHRTGNETIDEIWTQGQVNEMIAAKQKPVLIAVSNCNTHSAREKYVQRLQKHLPITIVGGCPFANARCKNIVQDRALHYDNPCMKEKVAEHYFYLAFENSICPEYQSEKFWRVKQLIVPVVLSRGVMPPHISNDTYIAASDFESPKQLADYLQHLMDNPSEYAKYFKWTQKYRKTSLSESEVRVSCQLCKLAYLGKQSRIADYKKYWSVDECPANYSINLINNSKENPRNADKWEEKFTDLMSKTYREKRLENILL